MTTPLPNSEPKSFKAPETPEGRDFDAKHPNDKGAQERAAAPHPDDIEDESDPHTDKQLDHGLKETFPASDPVSINPGAD